MSSLALKTHLKFAPIVETPPRPCGGQRRPPAAPAPARRAAPRLAERQTLWAEAPGAATQTAGVSGRAQGRTGNGTRERARGTGSVASAML